MSTELEEPQEFDKNDHIGRYIKFKSDRLGINFQEAAERSMGRLRTHIEGDKIVIIMTAFRSERSLKENRDFNRQLSFDIRSLGWGYIPVMGGYVEDTAEGKKRVVEESFFISIPASSASNQINPGILTGKVLELLKKYDQEAALLKFPSEDAHLLFQDGGKSPVGKWHADPSQMAQYYTLMRKGPQNRQFKFEAAGDDSRVTQWAVDAFFKHK